MADSVRLPEGFVLDDPAQPSGLPEGFVLDEPQQEQTILQQAEQLPGVAPLAEFAAGANRGILGALDFLGPDTINAILELSGSENRVPTFTESLGAPQGSFVEGKAGEILGAAGEAATFAAAPQAALRQAAQRIPRQAGSTTSRILTQAAQDTPQAAAALGAVSGAGAEIGEGVGGTPGAIIGSIMAPMAVSGIAGTVSGGINRALDNKQATQELADALGNMSDEGAVKLLTTAMKREGISPQDVQQRLEQLGPEAIPADLGANFSRLLRASSNQAPRIESQAANVFRSRQATQEGRILAAMDDATGTSSLNINDEIVRLEKATRPEIKRLYDEARAKDIQFSDDLNNLLTGDNTLGRAQRKVQRRLADKAAVGDQVTQLDVLDASKKELDDQIGKAIRQGESEKMRDLVRLKNKLVEEADEAVPEYKQARNLFAGKAQLETAGDIGQQFFKMKEGDLKNVVKNMSASEKEMFKLGAKQAVVDRFDDLNFNADAVNRLFGKRGTVKKLGSVFDSKEDLNRFNDALEREAQFILTRRQAQANSTTAKQLADDASAQQILQDTSTLIADPSGITTITARISDGLRRSKRSEEYTRSLETAGDILLSTGMKPEQVRKVLERANEKEITKLISREASKAQKLAIPSAAGLQTQEGQ